MSNAFLSLISVIFANAVVAYLYTISNPFFVMIWFYASATLITLSYLLYKKRLLQDFNDYKKIQVPANKMMVIGVFEGSFFFIGLAILGLSGSAITGQFATFITILYGIFRFGEKLNNTQWFFALLILIAGFSYAYETETILEKTGYLFAVTGGFLGFLLSVQQKIVAKHVDGLFILMMRASFMTLLVTVCYFFIPIETRESSNHTLLIITLACFAGVNGPILNHYLKMKSYHSDGLSLTTLIRSSYPIWMFLIGIFFLHEELSDIKLLCALIMLPASLGLAWVTIKGKNGR